MPYLIIPIFAILNRARGTQFFSMTGSTSEGRIISMLLMGIVVSLLKIGDTNIMFEITGWTWAALMFWCVFAWDVYWGMAIGTSTAPRPSFAPVDWIMARLYHVPPLTGIQQRIWGLIAMCLRMTLAAPWVIGLAFIAGHPENAWLAVFTPLLAVPYLIYGLLFTWWPKFDAYTIAMSELTIGAMLGNMAILALQ